MSNPVYVQPQHTNNGDWNVQELDLSKNWYEDSRSATGTRFRTIWYKTIRKYDDFWTVKEKNMLNWLVGFLLILSSTLYLEARLLILGKLSIFKYTSKHKANRFPTASKANWHCF